MLNLFKKSPITLTHTESIEINIVELATSLMTNGT